MLSEPPYTLTAHAPPPVRVFTLGRFSILKNDIPLIFTGKSQKKPISLLKVLIAMGGRGISSHILASTLWEDTETTDARHALEMAVSRLRKLIGHDHAITVHDGKISLDTEHVWVDSFAFERKAGEYDTLCVRATQDERLALGSQVIDLYNGIFLQGDDESPWLLGRRDRLHSRFLRLVAHHGNELKRSNKHDLARTCYLKALELDPLAEEVYQQLMTCLLEQGERAQALEIYRRCRKMLSIVLGVSPSFKTESLAEVARRV